MIFLLKICICTTYVKMGLIFIYKSRSHRFDHFLLKKGTQISEQQATVQGVFIKPYGRRALNVNKSFIIFCKQYINFSYIVSLMSSFQLKKKIYHQNFKMGVNDYAMGNTAYMF